MGSVERDNITDKRNGSRNVSGADMDALATLINSCVDPKVLFAESSMW